MEILHQLWNALTCENEILLNIIRIPLLIIELTLTFFLFTTLLNISFSKKNALIYIITHSILACITLLFIPTPFNALINLIIYMLLVYLIIKTDILTAIISVILSFIIMVCIGTPLLLLHTSIFNLTYDAIFCIPIHQITYYTILYLIIFVLYILFKKLRIQFTNLNQFDSRTYNTMVINFLVGTFAIAMQAYTQYLYIGYIPTHLIIISFSLLLVYFFISMYSLFRTSQLEKTKELLKEEQLYNQALTNLHDNIRGFKHDFNNIVQVIGGYISTNNMEGLKLYYNDLVEDCQFNNNLSVFNPELINNPAIYSLLADKFYKSQELGIKLNIEVFLDLNTLNIKAYELARILGILLDNAIDASKQCEKKIINITFKKDKKANNSLIIIQNTYLDKDINIDRIFEKGYSTKTDDINHQNHGLGLWEVRKYLKKHTNLDLYTTKSSEFFTQQFEIYP